MTEELIDSEFQVLAFKGMPGSGAKKAISRIALEADGLGLDTQQYHCPFDVDELEMLIIPHLKRVIVHTSPRLQNHDLVFSSNQKVAFIDFDQGLNLESIYEFDEEIKDTKKRFNDLIDGAVAFIARAKATHGKVEKYYINAMDFHKVNSKKMEILERIFGDSKNKT